MRLDKTDKLLLSYSLLPKHKRKSITKKEFDIVIKQYWFEEEHRDVVDSLLGFDATSYDDYRLHQSKVRADALGSIFAGCALGLLALVILL